MIGLLATLGSIIGGAAIAPLVARLQGKTLSEWWRS